MLPESQGPPERDRDGLRTAPTAAERRFVLLWALAVVAVVALKPVWLTLAPLLPVCSLRATTGIPCPTCGTTRAAPRSARRPRRRRPRRQPAHDRGGPRPGRGERARPAPGALRAGPAATRQPATLAVAGVRGRGAGELGLPHRDAMSASDAPGRAAPEPTAFLSFGRHSSVIRLQSQSAQLCSTRSTVHLLPG